MLAEVDVRRLNSEDTRYSLGVLLYQSTSLTCYTLSAIVFDNDPGYVANGKKF